MSRTAVPRVHVELPTSRPGFSTIVVSRYNRQEHCIVTWTSQAMQIAIVWEREAPRSPTALQHTVPSVRVRSFRPCQSSPQFFKPALLRLTVPRAKRECVALAVCSRIVTRFLPCPPCPVHPRLGHREGPRVGDGKDPLGPKVTPSVRRRSPTRFLRHFAIGHRLLTSFSSMLPLRSLVAAFALTLVLPASLLMPHADALHVAIICSFGTRSDIAPIFEGLRDFALEDGNTVSYVAAPGIATSHAAQFPYVTTDVIPNVILPAYFNNSAIADVMQTKKKYDNTRVFLDAIGFISDIYEHNTQAYIDYFDAGHTFDLVMCDAVEQACMDAAKHTGQKLAIYGPLGQYGVGSDWYVPDFLDPMPMEQWIASPWKRAKGFVDLIPFAIETIKASWQVQAAQKRLNLNVPYMEPWEFPQKHLMLAHHMLGIDPARNVPTNIQVFGPVVNEETIPPIEPEFKKALDGYKAQGVRAVFIAFGSVLTLEDSPELYDTMLASIDALLGDPDRHLAVIWASAFHDTSRTAPIQSKYPGRFLTPKWANQRRALMHDAVHVAINHAGYGSITEALYNGKAQIMLPFVFDEFVNTANAEEAGISLSLDKYTMTSDEMTLKVTTLMDQVADPTSAYAQNLQKWKTICRLNSEKAKMIVSNAVKIAASVGVEHLVPRDVTLSVFDRFDIVSVALALLVLSTLRKLLGGGSKLQQNQQTPVKGKQL